METQIIRHGDTWSEIQQDSLALGAGLFSRRWTLGPLGAVTQNVAIDNKLVELSPPVDNPLVGFPKRAGDGLECSYEGLNTGYRGKGRELQRGHCDARICETDALLPTRLIAQAHWTDPRQGYELRRNWHAWPGSDAITTWASVRSDSAPMVAFDRGDYQNVIDTLPANLLGWSARCVTFRGCTDETNALVEVASFIITPDSQARSLRGNLLFLESPDREFGLFMLHDGLPEGEWRRECDARFVVDTNGVRALGWGFGPREVSNEQHRESYRVTTGAYRPSVRTGFEAMRRFLSVSAPVRSAERVIVVNPWGDRRLYKRLDEAFVLREIDATAAVGAEVYQIDDGWQAGGTLGDLIGKNLAIDESFWRICPRRFPRGFEPLAARAKERGVKLALWFAPDSARNYQTWQWQRDLLLHMHRNFGMDLFKIDGANLRTKSAEDQFVELIQSVIKESDGRVSFNLDITLGPRLGYFYSQRLGNLFVENRYVTASDEFAKHYYPHSTLRNLWNLAWYVPPLKMQFEIPNVDLSARGPGHPDRNLPLDGTQHRWDYIAAVPLMAAPLLWCEPSSLSPEATAAIKHVLGLHRAIRPRLLNGCTLPIGAEPDGHQWTGLQSVDGDDDSRGLVQVFRELNDSPTARMRMNRVSAGSTVTLQCLSHDEPDVTLIADDNGVPFTLDRAQDYRLYSYQTRKPHDHGTT